VRRRSARSSPAFLSLRAGGRGPRGARLASSAWTFASMGPRRGTAPGLYGLTTPWFMRHPTRTEHGSFVIWTAGGSPGSLTLFGAPPMTRVGATRASFALPAASHRTDGSVSSPFFPSPWPPLSATSTRPCLRSFPSSGPGTSRASARAPGPMERSCPVCPGSLRSTSREPSVLASSEASP
jgi:hypothetical protein